MAFDAGAAIGKIKLDTTSWETGVKKVTTGQKFMAKGAKTLGLAFTAAAALIGAGITASIKKADEWQKSFANVSTLVDTATVDMQGMAKELLALDSRLGSARDLTDGLYQALSASVEPAKAVEFVGTAAEFAKAALTDTNTAVDVITTGLNAYGLEAEKATEISDQLFSVIKLGKTTGAELSAVIGQSIPLAANMGIEFAELGASIAVMTRQGISASEATTQFNGVVNAFLKPSEEMTAGLKAMGFESGQAAIETLGVKGTLDQLVKSTGGSKEALAGLFNNTRALRGVMALTGKGATDFGNILSEIEGSAGATREAFDKQEITFDTLKNTLDKTGVIVGNVGKVFADELAVGATKAANSMIQFLLSGQGAQVISDIIAGVTAAFSAFKVAVEPITDALMPALKSIWDEISSAANTLGGDMGDASGAFNIFGTASNLAAQVITVFGKQIAFTIENVVNLVTAIKESGGAISTFFKFITGKASWDEVKDQVSAAGEAFKTFGLTAVENVADVVTGIIDNVKNFGEESSKIATDVEITWTSSFKRTKNSVIDNYDEMITGQNDFVAAVVEGANATAETLSNILLTGTENEEEAADKRFKIITALSDKTIKTSADVWERIKQIQADSVNAQKRRMMELRAEFQKTAQTYLDTFLPVLEQVGTLIVDQEKGWDAVKDAGKNAIATIVEAFAKQWALQAAAEWAAVFAGAVGRVPAALGYTAAASGAQVAAGAIRALRTGGFAAGMTLVGEEGPELVNLPGGSRVFSNSQTQNMIQGGNINITNIVRSESDIERINRKFGRTYAASLRGTSV